MRKNKNPNWIGKNRKLATTVAIINTGFGV